MIINYYSYITYVLIAIECNYKAELWLCGTELCIIVTNKLNRTAVLRSRFDVSAVYLRSNEINCHMYAAAWTRVRIFQ
jgi:hypothetical protein